MNQPTRSTKIGASRFLRMLGASLLAAILYGCGDSIENSPNVNIPTNNSCAAAVDVVDCESFRDSLWQPYLIPNCNGCHRQGGSGVGEFADSDVVVAHQAVQVNNRVNRNDPANSLLVTKVDLQNHRCWVDLAGEDIEGDCAESASRLLSGINNWLNPTAPPTTGGGGGEDLGSVASRLENPTVDVAPVAEQITLGSTPGALQDKYGEWIWDTTSGPYVSGDANSTRPNCGRCHSETAPQAQRQQPYFADSNLQNAFNAVVETRKIDINNPANSRMYLRLAQDSHNCWSDCAANAATMLAAIQGWKNEILSGSFTPPPVEGTEDTLLTTSQGMQLDQGQVISGGSRVTAGQIALWEFKEGAGNVAQDTSGVAPQIDLVLNDQTNWVGGWGIEFGPGGRATASSITASQKLRNQIANNNAFTIEAWVVPGNVTQEGPAIIASYSFSPTERNFSIGQTLYSYEFLNRNTASGLDVANRANGQPTLITDPDDEDLQATQQHVVMTYDATNGRRIYVNGQFTGDADSVTGGSLSEWDSSYVFILGSDVGGANQWLGKIRMVAIYNRALTEQEITQNFDAGVGQKFHLLFKVGHLSTDLPDTSYIWFEVAEFDDYSYLFVNPAFIVLDPEDGSAITPTSISNLDIQGMRIGVNGKLPTIGQAFLNMNETISMPNLTDTNNARYVNLIGTTTATIDGVATTDIPVKATGTIIAKERGPNATPPDQFYLTFENFAGVIGAQSQNGEPIPLNYNYPAPVTGLANDSYIAGVRLFEEINASMSALTGIDTTNNAVRSVFLEIQQQLPSGVAMEGFLASHQIGIAKLALTYCGELVDNTSFFGSLNTSNAADRETIVNTLYTRFIIDNVASQPSLADVRNELIGADGSGGLVADLSNAGATNPTILKSMCLAVLGSASTTVQ